MLIRAIALSLALLIGIGAIIPLATETTEAGPRHHRKYRSHHRHYKKYSRAWWKQYHARQRRHKALAARRRALRLQQIRLAKSGESSAPGASTKGVRPTPVKADEGVALLPTGDAAPQGWKRTGTSPGELQFRVDNPSGSQIGSAAISVVGSAMGDSGDRGRASFVGGVPTTSLRRDVINRMVRENGWVVNDYQKDVSGKKVYVVVAQSQASGGRVQSRMFYFTEVDGRIYSVATNASSDDAERLAEESEKVLNSLARVRPQQQAAVKE